MKKLLTIALLLITATCFAGDISTIAGKAIGSVSTIAGKAKTAIATVGGGGVPAVASSTYCGGGCSGAVLFCWGVSTNDTTITNSDGCSVGDTTATAASDISFSTTQAKYGTHSIKPTSTSDYYEFAVSSEDIVSSDAGRIEAWVYNPAGNASNTIVFVRGDGTNTIYLDYANNKIRIQYRGNNLLQSVIHTSDTVVDDGWTFVVGSWSVAGVEGNYLRVGTSTDGSTPTNWVYGTTAITDMTVNPTSVRIGETAGTGYDHYIDAVKIYNTW